MNSTDLHNPIKDQILFRDEHLIILNKKPGQLVQPDRKGDVSLCGMLSEYLKKFPGLKAVVPGIVHRIDRLASGAVVFTLNKNVLARMNEKMRNGEIRKIYWAVTPKKDIEPSAHLIHYIYNDQKINRSYISEATKPGVVKAELDYRIISGSDRYMMLEINLITGRRHQIRAQLAAIGVPVKGDLKYGSKRSNPNGLIHLHSRELGFIHPLTGAPVIITADPPEDVLWNFFLKCPKSQNFKP